MENIYWPHALITELVPHAHKHTKDHSYTGHTIEDMRYMQRTAMCVSAAKHLPPVQMNVYGLRVYKAHINECVPLLYAHTYTP